MSTKLLRQVQEQDQQELADRYNGDAKRQPRRVWAVEALKPELTEAEYEAGQRAVRECILFFPGAKANYDRVDMAWSDASLAGQVDAGHALFGLRQGVSKRSNYDRAPLCAEWLVQLYTLQEIASGYGWLRSKGADRPLEPDLRRTKPFVRLVLMAMADYYADCDRGIDSWKGAKGIDEGPEHMPVVRSCFSRAQG